MITGNVNLLRNDLDSFGRRVCSVVMGMLLVLVLALVLSLVVAATCFGTQESEILPNQSTIKIVNALVTVTESVNVPVERAGVLTELNVRAGQIVAKGELIGRLKDDELKNRRDRAQLDLQIAKLTAESGVDVEYAQKSYWLAESELQRAEQANSRVANSIPLARIEKMRLENERTRLQLQQAERESKIVVLRASLVEQEVQLTELQLAQSFIRAPASGMVVSVESHAGEWVQPSQTLVKIVAVDRLKIEGFVSAQQASSIRVGMPVQVEISHEWISQTVPGEIVFVSPEANPVNLNVVVWVELENRDGKLMPGLRGDVLIEP